MSNHEIPTGVYRSKFLDGLDTQEPSLAGSLPLTGCVVPVDACDDGGIDAVIEKVAAEQVTHRLASNAGLKPREERAVLARASGLPYSKIAKTAGVNGGPISNGNVRQVIEGAKWELGMTAPRLAYLAKDRLGLQGTALPDQLWENHRHTL